jgi:putative aldouronate transport system permease protein
MRTENIPITGETDANINPWSLRRGAVPGVSLLKRRGGNSLKTRKIEQSSSGSWVNTIWLNNRNDIFLYLMFLPVFIYYLVFRFAPIVGAFILSFKRYDIVAGIAESPWIGMENFFQFWNSVFFVRLIRNTLMINLYSLAFGFTAPIILALLINEIKNKYFKNLIQTVTYFPYFISTVVVVSIVVIFLSPVNGVINNMIHFLGGQRVNFLTKSEYFWPVYTVMNIWQTTGFNAIIYLAALTAIPQELYEAAMTDGAGRWRQLWHITLPGISTTIVILLLMRLGHLLEVGYESIILLYSPGIYDTADVINTYVYRRGMLNCDYSFASAVGLFQSMIGLVLVILSNKVARKTTESGLW